MAKYVLSNPWRSDDPLGDVAIKVDERGRYDMPISGIVCTVDEADYLTFDIDPTDENECADYIMARVLEFVPSFSNADAEDIVVVYNMILDAIVKQADYTTEPGYSPDDILLDMPSDNVSDNAYRIIERAERLF